MSARHCLTIAALFGFLTVALGAFGAHGLKDSGYLTNRYATEPARDLAGLQVPASYKFLRDFETGVQYQGGHSLAMFGAGLLLLKKRCPAFAVAAWCFLSGILLFSGPLYVITIGGPRWMGIPWGAVAPVGGTLLLVGWLALARGVWSLPSPDSMSLNPAGTKP